MDFFRAPLHSERTLPLVNRLAPSGLSRRIEAGANAAVSNATDTDTGSSGREFEQWLFDWLKTRKKAGQQKKNLHYLY
jgi:hypothetical protein